MVDAKRNRIERVFHPKFPLEYIQRPEMWIRDRREALSVLEPYGSGTARPLFCLLGATLLRTQNRCV